MEVEAHLVYRKEAVQRQRLSEAKSYIPSNSMCGLYFKVCTRVNRYTKQNFYVTIINQFQALPVIYTLT